MELVDTTEYVDQYLMTQLNAQTNFRRTSFIMLSPINIAINVLIVTVIFICGILGNGTTIRILLYSSSNNYQNKIFMISLALVDIFACSSALFTFPFLLFGTDTTFTAKLRFTTMTLVANANVYILALIGFDRLIAVYHPFKYNAFEPIRKVLLCIAMIIISLASALSFIYIEHKPSSHIGTLNQAFTTFVFSLTTFGWILICIFYSLLVVQLRSQGKRVSNVVQQRR